MTQWLSQPTTIWLTGASSGIGDSLARALLADGHHLIATSRRRETLEALGQGPSGKVTVAPADTTSRDDLARIQDTLDRQHPVQMAILNAGTCEYLDVRRFDADIIENNVRTNLLGTAYSVETVLPALRAARDEGLPARLVIVSSSAWWFPFARAEGYGASKAGLTYFAESLRADLAAEGIGVTVVSPGFVKTPLTDQNDFPMPFLIEADDAAQRIVKGLRQGRNRIDFPKPFTVTLKLLRLLPRRWADALAARMARSEDGASS
ncbi:short-subunit dehydrogenase [Tamilnaduibacter salinus]|uniref:Short-chain dehydrogenase n=1 Tax=Tamilnaduibacter salinus TaxID=1484056 RepID=A0A2A2HYR4_9GAMM|nr:SDR family NAD(P)-dependent oxidoreductase [Tamilnaduibacter salinus]PAV24561.1 short-chain dehydrogenase [Tamilnaduibacter salinus]PVY78068.1 short-subunit dehydrogenase [Tamilnaduibacter salinus]